jgi:hypothetical protein
VLPGGSLLFTYYGDCAFRRADAWSFSSLAPGEAMTLTPEPIAGCTLWNSGEGITALPGRVVARAEPDQLLSFPIAEPAGTWTATVSQRLQYGIPLSEPSGLAWDETHDRFLTREPTSFEYNWPNAVYSVDQQLRNVAPLRTLSTDLGDLISRNFSGPTYRADLDAAVVGHTGRAVADFPAGYPLQWEQTRTPTLVVAPSDASVDLQKVELSAALQQMAASGYPVYFPGKWGNGASSLAYLPDEHAYAVRLGSDAAHIHVLGEDGAWLRTIPVSVPCADPAMTFTFTQVAHVPAITSLGARFVVVGSCATAAVATPEEQGPPLLAFLDGNGGHVFSLDAALFPKTSSPSHVTAITSGLYAGVSTINLRKTLHSCNITH